jgi:hypothetical protein
MEQRARTGCLLRALADRYCMMYWLDVGVVKGVVSISVAGYRISGVGWEHEWRVRWGGWRGAMAIR